MMTMAGLGADETVELTQTWSAEEVDRIRVVVDEENVVLEANDDDNEAEHGLEVAYAAGFGWKDSTARTPGLDLLHCRSLLLRSWPPLHNARPSTTARAPSTMRKKRPGTRTATTKTTMSTTTSTGDSRLLVLSDGQDGARLYGSEIV